MDNTICEVAVMRDGINATLRNVEALTGVEEGSLSLPDGVPHIVEFGEALHYHSARVSSIFYRILGTDGGVYMALDSMVMKFSEGHWVYIKGAKTIFCSLGDISPMGVGQLSELPAIGNMEELEQISISILILDYLISLKRQGVDYE